MIIYDLARRAKHVLRDYKKKRDCKYVTTVRRIERVFPPKGQRLVAMTFDDGPTDIETNPKVSEDGLTLHLLKTLEKYGAKGTFDVIGTTEHNYPDVAGEENSFTWGGVKFDHYPDINLDMRAGAKNKPELIKRILDGGHEITNHGYRHVLFGKMKLVYGDRESFNNIHEVVEDLMTLDSLLEKDFGYKMKLSRPPHYVDKIPDGKNSYDAYRYLGYNYMAASFDGGGWLPTGSFESDVEAMVAPLRRALSENPDALNGQIIFQKDGFSMARLSPVAAALPKQLELLSELGYKVITVSELLALSSFEDAENEYATALANAGYAIGYKNNTLHPEKVLTFGELVAMTTNPEKQLSLYREFVDSGFSSEKLPEAETKKFGVLKEHPYFIAFCLALQSGILDSDNKNKLSYKTPVTGSLFTDFIKKLKPGLSFEIKNGKLLRGDVFSILADALLK
ncbi:MAG: polysaccharide deacetylase family protein [Oscillospiraceae bacterium]|nr:polysaccharide deacetylase family protein [Oscillospiraceae bacterium]